MVFQHISKDIKDRALFLLENDYILDDVAEILGISTRSISRWGNNLEEDVIVTGVSNSEGA